MRGRYAPSPTGQLHLGNARTALVAWWHSRKFGGQFILRVEDLDSARSRQALIATNMQELRWLGLDWDEGPDMGGPHAPYLQSERHGFYQQALGLLMQQGRIFQCYLSRKDLRELSSAPHGALPPYGECERQLNDRLGPAKQREGKLPALRYRVDVPEVSFVDELQGQQSYCIGDFVVRRADNEWAYQLAVVVDDIAMGISNVVRGADLLESSAAQILLYEALEAAAPRFWHVPLLLDMSGERMAKRNGALTLSTLQHQGIRPQRVVGFLAYSLGLVEQPGELTASEALELYTPERLNRLPYRLEPQILEWLRKAAH